MSQPDSWANPDKIIRAELEPDEKLLWAGRPRQGFVVRATDAVFYLFGLSFVGIVVLPLVGLVANNNGLPPNLLLMSVPHIVFGTAFLLGRPISDIWLRARTAYGVTSERVLFVSGLFGRQVKSLELDSMRDARLTPRGSSGGGTIRFGCGARKQDAALAQQFIWFSALTLNAFELERDVHAVYRLIDAALQGPARGRNRSVVDDPATKTSVPPSSWEHPDTVVGPELKPGELLLWAGRPRLGFVINWYDIIGLALAFVWMNVFFIGGGFAATLWFLLVLKALHVAVHAGRASVSTWRRSHTAYAVTTKRVIVMTATPSRRVTSLHLGAVAEVTLTKRAESSSGTLVIGPDVPRYANHANFVRMGATPTGMLRLDLAHDAQLVYRLVRRSRRPLSALPAGEHD